MGYNEEGIEEQVQHQQRRRNTQHRLPRNLIFFSVTINRKPFFISQIIKIIVHELARMQYSMEWTLLRSNGPCHNCTENIFKKVTTHILPAQLANKKYLPIIHLKHHFSLYRWERKRLSLSHVLFCSRTLIYKFLNINSHLRLQPWYLLSFF